jgi:hypothetical protein
MPGSWSKSLASRPIQHSVADYAHGRVNAACEMSCISACVCARKWVHVRARDPLELLGPNLSGIASQIVSPCPSRAATPGYAGRAALGHPLVRGRRRRRKKEREKNVSAIVHSPDAQCAQKCQRARPQATRAVRGGLLLTMACLHAVAATLLGQLSSCWSTCCREPTKPQSQSHSATCSESSSAACIGCDDGDSESSELMNLVVHERMFDDGDSESSDGDSESSELMNLVVHADVRKKERNCS